MKQFLTFAIATLLLASPASMVAKNFTGFSAIDNKTSINDDRTEARKLLAAEVQKISKNLPKELGDGFTMSAVAIESNYLVFTFTIDDPSIPFEVFPLLESELKTQLLNEILDAEGGLVRDLLVKAGIGSKITFKDKNSNAQHTFRIEINEISMGATAQTMKQGGKSEAYEKLNLSISVAQKALQTASPEMRDMLEFSLEPGCLSAIIKVDGRKINLDDIKLYLDQISPKELASQMNLTPEVISLCKEAEVNIKFVYQDTESIKKVEFVIPYADL